MGTNSKLLPRSPDKRAARPRVVAIKFDDGTELAIDGDLALWRYLEEVQLDRGLEAICGPTAHWSTVRLTKELIKAAGAYHLEQKREQHRKNASGPRSPITKEQILQLRDEYIREEGRARGWKKWVCQKLLIDPKTLNDRLAD